MTLSFDPVIVIIRLDIRLARLLYMPTGEIKEVGFHVCWLGRVE